MKKLILILALVLCAILVRATGFPLANAYDTANNTMVSAGAVSTNVASSVLTIEKYVQHTIHVINTGTNNAKVTIERSLDGSNWQNLGTNAVNASTLYETNFVGKWSYLQVRTYITNSTMTVLYLGGR